MNYSVADAITAMGGGEFSSRAACGISDLLPFGIAPGAKVVMRREKAAAEHVRASRSGSAQTTDRAVIQKGGDHGQMNVQLVRGRSVWFTRVMGILL